MKRTICFLLAALFVAFCFSGCQSNRDDGKIDIVCTVFPIYDWVENMLGDIEGVEVSLLVQNGTDPHSYSPTPADIAKISSCDMLIFVGGESDSWVSDVLAGKVNEEMKQLKLLDMMGDRLLEEEHGHEGEEAHESGAYDEHVWLSLKNAKMLCERISAELGESLRDEEDIIKKNAEDYISRISKLDERFFEAVESGTIRTLLFADRFPFGYMAEDYSLECFAAFSGCSADSEASFETVTSLAAKIDELSLEYVLILENSNDKLANTIISSSTAKSAEILTIDSLQSITSSDIADGVTYLSIMESNLEVIKKALRG